MVRGGTSTTVPKMRLGSLKSKGSEDTPTSASSLAPFDGPTVARSPTFEARAITSVKGTPQFKDEYVDVNVSDNDAVSAL